MNAFKPFVRLFLISIFVFSVTTVRATVMQANGSSTVVVEVKEKKEPLVTRRCLQESSSGRCHDWELTYSYSGAECVADCLELNSFGRCKLSNICIFDEASECFTKKVCEDHNGTRCKEWSETPACD